MTSHHGPRVEPLPEEEWDDDARQLIELTRSGAAPQASNIFTTLAHHPKLFKRWMVFGTHILFQGVLPPRDRELLILRTGWNCGSDYEWGQHVRIGLQSGLTEAEIDRIPHGPSADGWDPFDTSLLAAADELHESQRLSDATWEALGERYDTKQLIEAVFTVGQYHLVAMALNTLGVEREEGVPGLPVL